MQDQLRAVAAAEIAAATGQTKKVTSDREGSVRRGSPRLSGRKPAEVTRHERRSMDASATARAATPARAGSTPPARAASATTSEDVSRAAPVPRPPVVPAVAPAVPRPAVAPAVAAAPAVTLTEYLASPVRTNRDAVLKWVANSGYDELLYPLAVGAVTFVGLAGWDVSQGFGLVQAVGWNTAWAGTRAALISGLLDRIPQLRDARRQWFGLHNITANTTGLQMVPLYGRTILTTATVAVALVGLIVGASLAVTAPDAGANFADILRDAEVFSGTVRLLTTGGNAVAAGIQTEQSLTAQIIAYWQSTGTVSEFFQNEQVAGIILQLTSGLIRLVATLSQPDSVYRQVADGLTAAGWGILLGRRGIPLFFFMQGIELGRLIAAGVSPPEIFEHVGALVAVPATSGAGGASWGSQLVKGMKKASTPTNIVGLIVGLGSVAYSFLTTQMTTTAFLASVGSGAALWLMGGIGVGLLVEGLAVPRFERWNRGDVAPNGVPVYDIDETLAAAAKLQDVNSLIRNREATFQGMCEALIQITATLENLSKRPSVAAGDFYALHPALTQESTAANVGQFSFPKCDQYLQGVCTRFVCGIPSIDTNKDWKRSPVDGSVTLDPGQFSNEMIARMVADVMTPCVLCGAVLVQVFTLLRDYETRLQTLFDMVKGGAWSDGIRDGLWDMLTRVLLHARVALELAQSITNILATTRVLGNSARDQEARNGGFGFVPYLKNLAELITISAPGVDPVIIVTSPLIASRDALVTRMIRSPYLSDPGHITALTVDYIPTFYFMLVTTMENVLTDIATVLAGIVNNEGILQARGDATPATARGEMRNVLSSLAKYTNSIRIVRDRLRSDGQRAAVRGDISPDFEPPSLERAMQWYIQTFVNDSIVFEQGGVFWNDPSVTVFARVRGQAKEQSRAARRVNIREVQTLISDPAWHKRRPAAETVLEGSAEFRGIALMPATTAKAPQRAIIQDFINNPPRW